MAKRGENIRKRKDGRYEARYQKGIDTEGKVVWGSVYGKTYNEAKKRKLDRMIAIKENEQITNDVPFAELISIYLLQERLRVKETTFSHYFRIISKHILPFFSKFHCSEIKSTDIESFAFKKQFSGRLDGDGGLSAKTVKDMLSVLKKILKYGIDKNLINEECLRFSCPRIPKNKIQVLTKNDLFKLCNICLSNNDLITFGIYLSLFTGIRIGELCALRWSDIDLTNSTMTINKTMSRIYETYDSKTSKTKIIIDSPKTSSSERIIPLPSSLVKEIIKRRQNIKNDETFFLTGTNDFIEPRTYYSKYKKILEANSIQSYSFHALRHTFATNCIERGFDAKTLSEILGHSSVKVTLERYVHPSLELKRSCMEMLIQNEGSLL